MQYEINDKVKLTEYSVGNIIQIVRYSDRMMEMINFLIKNKGKAYPREQLCKKYNLTEQTMNASVCKVAKQMGYFFHRSQANNFNTTLCWVDKRQYHQKKKELNEWNKKEVLK